MNIPKGICYGLSDVTVAPSFPEEMAEVSARVRQFAPFDATYSSPLGRCTVLADHLSNKVIIDQRLREYDFGKWEQMDWNKIYETDEGRKWFDDWVNTACPDGESFHMLLDRVTCFIHDLPANAEKLLIVTHAGIIRAFLILLEGYSVEQAFGTPIAYGQIVTIETDTMSSVKISASTVNKREQ